MIICPKCGIEYSGAERFCPKDGTRLGTGEGQISKIPSITPGQDPLINKIIQGRYKVLRQIGEGGMGVVYEAEHIEIEKKVALKILRDDFSKRPEVVARFRQEARSASKIGNAHIVDVTDFGQLETGGVYFVMEYLQGKGLNEIIKNEEIDVERAVHIVLQIARALKAAHKMEIVHRDLKPENIYIVEKDEETEFVKILDFGIAKISDRDSEGQRLTKTGMIFGTPEYMSPEQASGKTLDQRVDIYALGCIMFEIFTGRVPFEGETFMAILTQHMFEPPPKLEDINKEISIPNEIESVIYKAMAKDQNDRYSDMLELAEDLEKALRKARDTQREATSIGKYTDYRVSSSKEYKYSLKNSGRELYGLEKRKINWLVLKIVALALSLTLAGGYYIYLSGWVSESSKEIPKEKLKIEARREENTKNVTRDTKKETNRIERIDSDIVERLIEVTIRTDPENAEIEIEGIGLVCKKSPCKIELKSMEEVDVVAKIDNSVKKIKYVPSEDNKEINIQIKKRSKQTKKEKGSMAKEQSSSEEGLKIPNIFQNN
jgi:serine/threonine-protein kinase